MDCDFGGFFGIVVIFHLNGGLGQGFGGIKGMGGHLLVGLGWVGWWGLVPGQAQGLPLR